MKLSDDFKFTATIAIAILMVPILLLGAHAGYKEYSRFQKRADANNQIKVHSRLVQIEEQQAEIRRAEARGIRDSQQIINETLTPQYLQYLAIQAQREWAQGDNSVIYLPTDNGVPLVQEVNP